MPGRLPGSAKTGGRRAGTPNRDTIRRKEDLLSRIEMIELEMGLDPGSLHPVEGLARIAGNKSTPLDVKVDCLKSIAPYCIPKLATVTVKGDEDSPIIVEHVNIDRFLLDPQLVAAAQRVALAMEEEPIDVAPEQRMLEMPAVEKTAT